MGLRYTNDGGGARLYDDARRGHFGPRFETEEQARDFVGWFAMVYGAEPQHEPVDFVERAHRAWVTEGMPS